MLSSRMAVTVSTIAVAGLVAAGGAFGAQTLAPAPALAPTEITIYEKPNFQGRSLTFTNRVPSLAAVGFNDLPSSVKIKGTRDWVLCEHRNFFGRCVRIHLKEKDLKRQKFIGVASSMYPVQIEPVKPRP